MIYEGPVMLIEMLKGPICQIFVIDPVNSSKLWSILVPGKK